MTRQERTEAMLIALIGCGASFAALNGGGMPFAAAVVSAVFVAAVVYGTLAVFFRLRSR